MSPSNIRYINQTGPFWDWVASLEDTAAEHPWLGGFAGPSGHPHPPPPGPHGPPPPGPPPPHHGPWWGPWGRRHNWHGHLPHHGPPQPPPGEGEEPFSSDEKRDNPEEPTPDPPEDAPQPPQEGGPGRRGRGRCGGDRRGHGHGRGFGGRHHHGHPYARGWGFPGRGGFGMLSELFQPAADGDNDWKPEADVFDTEGSYIVHLSLPGANKEDIGVNWDPEKSELNVAGVVHRPGDEEFLKTLALDERKVGAFERKVRLGTRANPAQVDVDGITAKLENGILLIDVPKLNGEYVEIKKVDIE